MDKDWHLIDKFKEGDTSAFRQIVDKYKDVSLSLACSILKDEQLAEDVLQDSFIKVYHKIDTFRGNSSFSTWLYRIVVNTSYNELKKQKRHSNINDIEENTEVFHREENIKNLKEADQKKYILLALQRLRSDEALVLRLFYLCEMKIKEISEITGFKESKIKVDMHRGRINFHEILKKIIGNRNKYIVMRISGNRKIIKKK